MSTQTEQHIVQGQAWDSFDAYLFDIDGTLMNCTDAVHYFAFCDALQELSGRALTLEGVVAHGNVDNGILRDALLLAGEAESSWRPRLPEMRERMCAFVAARGDELRINVLPNVRAILEYLRRRGAKTAVATGNYSGIGQLKLERAGLWEFFDFGGWSDAFDNRADVFRAAVERMRDHIHTTASICVLGDTPADIMAARANAIPVIAVATGIYPFEELQALDPDLCLHSLDELTLSA